MNEKYVTKKTSESKYYKFNYKYPSQIINVSNNIRTRYSFVFDSGNFYLRKNSIYLNSVTTDSLLIKINDQVRKYGKRSYTDREKINEEEIILDLYNFTENCAYRPKAKNFKEFYHHISRVNKPGVQISLTHKTCGLKITNINKDSRTTISDMYLSNEDGSYSYDFIRQMNSKFNRGKVSFKKNGVTQYNKNGKEMFGIPDKTKSFLVNEFKMIVNKIDSLKVINKDPLYN